jgi:DNA adenine methylase
MWLQGARITCGDYSPLLSEPGRNVFVYLDPPYMSDTERAQASQLYQFTFTMADHLTLRDKVATSPHKVCISYDNHPAIRELYSDFHIIEESWTYSGTSGAQRAVGQELVITNYEPLDYEVNPTAGEV